MKLKIKQKGKEHIFEIQEMSPLEMYNITTELRLGHIDFKRSAEQIIKECVVSPVEARKLEYFEEIPRVLDVLTTKCSEISKVGLTDSIEIEVIEE